MDIGPGPLVSLEEGVALNLIDPQSMITIWTIHTETTAAPGY